VADTGSDPDPLQRLSTRKVYVVTPIDVWDAQLVVAIDPDPLGGDLETQRASSRFSSAMS
jgi:hypothetical protein